MVFTWVSEGPLLNEPRRGGAVLGQSEAWGQVPAGRREGKLSVPEESLFRRWFCCIAQTWCKPQAHQRESAGPAAAGEGKVGEEDGAHPEACTGGGKDPEAAPGHP